MLTFRYRAKEMTGKTVEGFVEANTSEEALEKINELGYLPVKIEESKEPVVKEAARPAAAPPIPVKLKGGKIRSKEITIFGRQLASLIKSGVPILQAIGIVSEASENQRFKDLMDKIHSEIKNGMPLSQAMSAYPALFPPLYIALVQAGEHSGTLDQTLAKVTDYRQKQEEFFSRVRAALAYPILMALTGAGTIVFMLTFVMPRLMGIFERMGESLPLPTKILIGISTGLRQWWVWGIIAVAVILGVLLQSKKTKAQRLASSALRLKTPVIGTLTLKAEIARFGRTLELLVKSGIPILKAIEIAAPVVASEVLKDEFIHCLQDLKEGGSFGQSLKKSKRFPVFMTNLIVIGEASGKLDEALSEIAASYERETDEALRMMTSLLEPVMILVMGLVVGFIVIAMLLPMFELNMAVK